MKLKRQKKKGISIGYSLNGGESSQEVTNAYA
jgi:hypothetical protein